MATVKIKALRSFSGKQGRYKAGRVYSVNPWLVSQLKKDDYEIVEVEKPSASTEGKDK